MRRQIIGGLLIMTYAICFTLGTMTVMGVAILVLRLLFGP